MRFPAASIIINNHNYGRFLAAAIESALSQTYPNVEVVVVDDGSTDESSEVIQLYGDRIRAVFRPHRGQAAAFNSGIEAATGQVLFFLDADDLCEPHRVERVMEVVRDADPDVRTATLLFHPQQFCDGEAHVKAEYFPPRLVRLGSYMKGIREEFFPAGSMAVISTPQEAGGFLVEKCYLPFLTSATSGLAITRAMAERLFPIPEEGITICADSFIALGALLEGPVILINEALSRFRMHGHNRYMIKRKRPNADLFFNQRDAYLNSLARRRGLPEAILTLDNWDRVRRYLKNKPVLEILTLLLRSETHQYVGMLLRRICHKCRCRLLVLRHPGKGKSLKQKKAYLPLAKEARDTSS